MRIPIAGGPPELVLEACGITNLQCARLPSTLCLYSRAETSDSRFSASIHCEARDRRSRTLMMTFPTPTTGALRPNGSVLAIAKANKLDISVQPDIRLLTLKDGQERTIKLRGWPTVSSLDWAANGKSLCHLYYQRHKCTAECGPAGKSAAMVGARQDGRRLGDSFARWTLYLALWQASGNSNVWMVENFQTQ